MKHSHCIRFLMFAGMLGAGPAGLTAAHAGSLAMIANRPINPVDDNSLSAADPSLRNIYRTTSSAHANSLDWETGGFQLQGERGKSGIKSDGLSAPQHEWHRTLSAGASAWQDVTPGIALIGGLHLARIKSGSVGGSLLTRRTHTLSQEAYIGLKAGDQGQLKFSVFDRGGWSSGDVTELANRMTNGESRAKKGAALEIGTSGGSSDEFGDDHSRLAFRLEHSASSSGSSDNSAQLAWNVSF